jgi:hypothetical protein
MKARLFLTANIVRRDGFFNFCVVFFKGQLTILDMYYVSELMQVLKVLELCCITRYNGTKFWF